MTDSDQFSETYTKRRTINSGEVTRTSIKSIGKDKSDENSMVIMAGGEYYKIKLGSAIKSDYIMSKLLEFKDGETIDEKIEVYFNENMDKCGFSKEDYRFKLEHIGESLDIELQSSKEDVINEMMILSDYEKSSPLKKDGWRVDVSEINGKGSQSFKLVGRTDSLGVVKHPRGIINRDVSPEASYSHRLFQPILQRQAKAFRIQTLPDQPYPKPPKLLATTLHPWHQLSLGLNG